PNSARSFFYHCGMRTGACEQRGTPRYPTNLDGGMHLPTGDPAPPTLQSADGHFSCRSAKSARSFGSMGRGSTLRDWIPTEVLGMLGALCPARPATPIHVARHHIGAVAHPKEQRPLRPVGVFVQFPGRMDHERSGFDLHTRAWGPYLAPA